MFIRVKKDIGDQGRSVEKKVNLESTITCPYCGFQQKEKMPLDSCVMFYVCLNCKKVIRPIEGNCCIFCSYGDVKCPDKQINPE